MKIDRQSLMIGFALGGAAFIAASYILHCRFGMGPWSCQRADPRRIDAVFDAGPGRLHMHARSAPVQRRLP
jgi:hypothetical protein